jgi:hypothetical protein
MKDSACTVKSPADCSTAELDDFVALVRAGNEVDSVGLLKRVKDAHLLAFLRAGECLVGVAGLKFPSKNHRIEVIAGSGAALSAESFPLELGWIFVLPNARGGKSYPLCSPLVRAAEDKGIFATSRSENGPMHTTLAKLGFSPLGGRWPSELNPDNLLRLFVKHAV